MVRDRLPLLPAAALVAALLLAPPTARADEPPAEFESVVVGKRAAEDPFASDRSLSVLGDRALRERAPRSTPEALAEVPGVFVQQTNPGGGAPFVRGLVGPQNLILVDGVRLNNSLYRTGPNQYLNLIDPLAVDRIEVLRGPGSVLYGSDAMGGVVQVHPMAPRDYELAPAFDATGRALLRYGSADRQRTVHLDGELGGAGLGLLASGSFGRFDDLSGGRGVGAQPWSGYDRAGALANLVYRLPTAGALSGWTVSATYLMGRLLNAERGDKFAGKGSVQIYDNEDDLAWVRLRAPLEDLRTEAELTLSYQRFFERVEKRSFDDDRATELRRTRDDVWAHTLGLDLNARTALVAERLSLQYGSMWYRDWVRAEEQRARAPGAGWTTTGQRAFPDDASYDVYGAFLLLEGTPLRTASGHALRLSGGYRLHGTRAHAAARGELPASDSSDLGHVFHGGLRYTHADDALVAFTFSQGFRAPSLFEAVMLGDAGEFFHTPNADGLEPERSDTFELVARGRGGPLTVSVSAYASLLHDLVKREETEWQGLAEVDGKRVVRNVNGGEGIVWGVEGQVAVELGAGLSLSGHLTHTWGEEQVAGGPDEPLSRIPPLFGQLRLRWESAGGGDWEGFAETWVRGALEQDRLSARDVSDSRIPQGGTPGWWTWNLRLGARILDAFALGLTVENLLDEDYRIHGSGVDAAGTSAVLTFETWL